MLRGVLGIPQYTYSLSCLSSIYHWECLFTDNLKLLYQNLSMETLKEEIQLYDLSKSKAYMNK